MRYTKADLEQIVAIQLHNLHAMQDLVHLMKKQNDNIEKANKALENKILKFEKKQYKFAARQKAKQSRL